MKGMTPYRTPELIPIYEEDLIEREPMMVRVCRPRDPEAWSARYMGWVGIIVRKLGDLYLVQFEKDDASGLYFPDELKRVRPV